MAKKGYTAERERQLQLQEERWHVVRCSGSIGALDLVASRFSRSYLFEVRYEQVKSVKGKTFYFNKESKWELERLKEIYKNFGIPCFFAVKFKNKGWLIFDVTNLDAKPIKYEEVKNG